MSKFVILSLAFVTLLSGCSLLGGDKENRKILADGLTPKELYDLAEDDIQAGSIDQAIEHYEVILASYPSSKYAIQARLDIAYNLLKRKKYIRALNELDNFINKYPDLSITPYAFYLRGVVAEEKSTSILDKFITDSAQRDVQSVRDASNYYNLLVEKFPNSKYSSDAIKKIVLLENILAKHELYIAIYYTENYSHIAAINRLKYIIENFPKSTSIADSLYVMAFNYDVIGATQLSRDTRSILLSSFPEYSPSFSID